MDLWYLLHNIIKNAGIAVRINAGIAPGISVKIRKIMHLRSWRMEIDKEITTRKFESSYHKSAVNIIFTYGWLITELKKRLSKHDITVQQFNVLRILRGQYPDPSTINLLKDRMLDKMSDASRIVDRLIQKELVTRGTNKSDRRAVDINISEKGLEILKALDPHMNGRDFLKDNLTEREAEHLSELLDKFRG